MEFWKNLLDPSKNRKIKAFALATGLLFFGKITGDQWVITMGIYVASTASEKIAKIKNKV